MRGQVAVPSGAVGDQKAGLRRDGEAHIATDLKPVTAEELHLVEEEIDLAFERGAQGGGQFSCERHMVGDDGAVVFREGRGKQGRPRLPLLPKAVKKPAHDQQTKSEGEVKRHGRDLSTRARSSRRRRRGSCLCRRTRRLAPVRRLPRGSGGQPRLRWARGGGSPPRAGGGWSGP